MDYKLTQDEYIDNITKAVDFINMNGIYIIYPVDTLESLESLWNKFLDQPKQVRKKADITSYDIFGMDNFDHYIAIKDRLSKDIALNEMSSHSNEDISLSTKDRDMYKHVSSMYKKMHENIITESAMSELDLSVKEAQKEARDNDVAIVYPCDNLDSIDNLIAQYYAMSDSDRAISDAICKKYFNYSNEELYYKLKHKEYTLTEAVSPDKVKANALSFAKKYMKKIITYESPKVIMEIAFRLYNLLETDLDKKLFEDVITKDIADREVMDNEIVNIDNIYNDLPYFTADKMIDLGVFSGTTNCFDNIADNTVLEDGTSVEDWFEAYKNNQINYLKEHNLARVHTLQRLYSDLDEIRESGDMDKLNSRYQSILELGWDPNVAFSDENRAINDKKIKDFLDKKTKFIDLRGITDEDIPGYLNNSKGEKLYPIYIILLHGKRFISNLISNITKSDVSHAAIAFDADLKDVWTFNGDSYLFEDKSFGGLSHEPITVYNEHYVEVYCTFIKKKYYENLKYTIEYFKRNAKNYNFDYIGFLKYLFNVDVNETNKFMCSSFTDRMLQVANVNLRNNDEYKKLISPQKLKTDLSINNKIYMLYSGKANQYNGKKVDDLVKTISKNAEFFAESGILQENTLLVEDVDTDYITEGDINLSNYFSNKDMYNNDKVVKDFLDKKSRIIDLRKSSSEDIPGYFVSKSDEKLYPVYICLVRGQESFSKIVQFLTRSNVSHACVGFDVELDKLYSFNDDPKVMYSDKSKSGLSEESVDFFKRQGNLYIEVYVTFVKKKYYENLRYTLEYIKSHTLDYTYDYIGLVKFLFNLNIDEKDKFVCSSFTDRMLQVANINLRSNNKKLVSPSKLQKEMKSNNKIFCLYSGHSNDYNPKKMKKMVEKISKTASFFSEAVDLRMTFKKRRKFPVFFLYYYDNIYFSINPRLDELYYFNKNVNGSQLLTASANEFSQDAIVALYICFVTEDRYRKILDFIEEASAPFYKYTYSQLNILYKLMNINFGTNTPDKMCIEMIDKIIRLSDCVNAKKLEDIHVPVYKNLDDLIKRKLDIYGKIYKIYFDRLKNYNMRSTELFIASNIDDAKIIKESFSEGSFYRSVIVDPEPEERKTIKQPTAFKQLMENSMY